ncbi:MAG: alpha/beta hydrolase [Patescibacteria group bacterium]
MSLVVGSTRRNLIALAFFLFFYGAFGALLFFKQESIVYQPWPQDFDNCPALTSAERVTHQDTRIYFKNNGPKIVVIYHGNAGSACDRAFMASFFEQYGYSYALVEYAGYSNDAVSPRHDRVKKDVEHIVSFLEEHEFRQVMVVGESIGTGAAAFHAAIKSPSKLVLISPFTDLIDIARHRFWFYPTLLLVKNAFDNQSLLSRYLGPVLVLHGDADTIIQTSLGKELFESLQSKEKHMEIIQGAGHNTMFEYPATYESIGAFAR